MHKLQTEQPIRDSTSKQSEYEYVVLQDHKIVIRSNKTLNVSSPIFGASNQLLVSSEPSIQLNTESAQHPQGTPTSQQTVQYIYLDDPSFKLGQGSYGSVFKCYTKQSNKVYRFAVKVIKVPQYNESIASGQDIIQTTRQEIKTLMKFKDNPNIIKIQDLIRDDKLIYLVLEYCNDRDVIGYLRKIRGEEGDQSQGEEQDEKKDEKEFVPRRMKNTIHSIETINFFMGQLLNGFKTLYEHNIVHRDFKPGNILVNDGILKIADFGQSKPLFYRSQIMTESVGTECTKAPQIKFKQDYTAKCDIYSLGAVYYWMVYRKYPYKDNLTKEEYMKWRVEYADVGVDGFIVTEEVKNLVKGMLAYCEEDRPEWEELFAHRFFGKHVGAKTEPRSRMSFDRGMTMIQSEDFNQQIPEEFYKYITEKDIQLNRISVDQYQDFISIMRSISWFNLKISFFKEVMRELANFTSREDSQTQIEEETLCDIIRLGIQRYTIVLNRQLETELTFRDIPRILDAAALRSLQNQEQFHSYSKDLILEIHAFEESQQKPKLSRDKISRLTQKCKEYNIKEEFENILRDPKEGFDHDLAFNEIGKTIIEFFFLLKPEIKNFNFRRKQLKNFNEENRFKSLVLLVHHLNMFVMNKQIFPNPNAKGANIFGSQSHDIMVATDFMKREKFEDREAFLVLANEVQFLLDRFEE